MSWWRILWAAFAFWRGRQAGAATQTAKQHLQELEAENEALKRAAGAVARAPVNDQQLRDRAHHGI